jgi:ABC-type nitrate/sulfonate/bicarbonate transport system ATPase subunit
VSRDSAAVLELARIEHAYPGTGPVLAGVDLSIATGETVALVGPSGCGKSTLLAVAAGVLAPDSGHVLADGRDVTGRPGPVALMLQRDLLLEWRSVLGNVLLARHGLAQFADHYPHALSGGMRQRVALVRTLLAERRVLALDEPLALEERSGAALLVTHDVDEAVRLADRVVVLSQRPARIVSLVVLVWELVLRLGHPGPLVLPTPCAVLRALAQGDGGGAARVPPRLRERARGPDAARAGSRTVAALQSGHRGSRCCASRGCPRRCRSCSPRCASARRTR